MLSKVVHLAPAERPKPANDDAPATRVVDSALVSFGLVSLRVRIHAAPRPWRPRALRMDSLDLAAFARRSALSLTMVVRARPLSPDRGGERAYALLATVLERRELVGVGSCVLRGRRADVAIVPEHGTLVLAELAPAAGVAWAAPLPKFKDVEIDLAARIVDAAMVDRLELAPPAAGDEPETDGADIIDLFEALKRSLREAEQGRGRR